ncbi:MAG TPA: hypothetical protein VEY89_09380 [Candidatus Dormibacteraeota bacterium]|nr:hypothetical protein [Candidatus Dormibacteraeota bacterium]
MQASTRASAASQLQRWLRNKQVDAPRLLTRMKPAVVADPEGWWDAIVDRVRELPDDRSAEEPLGALAAGPLRVLLDADDKLRFKLLALARDDDRFASLAVGALISRVSGRELVRALGYAHTIDGYLRHCSFDAGDTSRPASFWAWEVMDLLTSETGAAPTAWQLLKEALRRADHHQAIAIGTGLLEDFLRSANEETLDLVVPDLRANSKLASVVCIYHLPEEHAERIWRAVGRRP